MRPNTLLAFVVACALTLEFGHGMVTLAPAIRSPKNDPDENIAPLPAKKLKDQKTVDTKQNIQKKLKLGIGGRGGDQTTDNPKQKIKHFKKELGIDPSLSLSGQENHNDVPGASYVDTDQIIEMVAARRKVPMYDAAWKCLEEVLRTFFLNLDRPESKKQEFRKYLEKSGVIDALTEIFVGLYEKPERPANAVHYIERYLGAPTGVDVEAIRAENKELKIENAYLEASIKDLNKRLQGDDRRRRLMYYQTPESKKQEFRKYLEKSGVVDALRKILVRLYEEPERPANAVDYIKRYIGAPTGVDVEAIRAENEELKVDKANLVASIKDLNKRLQGDD